MVNHGEGKESKTGYNLNLLRGWRRDQLKLLKLFVDNPLVPQTLLSGASGLRPGTHILGGKITALTRAGLIKKAGKDENGQFVWQLNEDKVEKQTLGQILGSIGTEPIKINISKQINNK